MSRRIRKKGLAAVLLALLLLPLLGLLPGCAWLAKQARGQLRLLRGRIPLEEALARPDLTEQERASLEIVPKIKDFGEQIVGLSPTRNYGTVNLDFDSVVWNVSGCAPDRFVSHVYRYPIVGALPYIGFFDEEDAEAELARLQSLGWEAWKRSAGAYSTLGWFKDPLWRSMLRWDEEQLSNTVLHELAHATVWIPGEGKFNESWAQFVGDRASEIYLESRKAERPEVWQALQDRQADEPRYRDFMQRLFRRLDALYGSGLPRGVVLRQKQRLIEEARSEYAALPWKLPGYAAGMDPSRPMNNARLVQFRVYNTGIDVFDEALARFGGDLRGFVTACRDLPKLKKKGGRGWEPYEAVKQLVPG